VKSTSYENVLIDTLASPLWRLQ